MTDLVSNHVGLGKVARRTESLLEFLEEREVEVEFLVEWAVERSHRGLADAARGFRLPAEHHHRRWRVLATEQFAPGLLGLCERHAREFAELCLGS